MRAGNDPLSFQQPKNRTRDKETVMATQTTTFANDLVAPATAAAPKKSLTRFAAPTARVLLGLCFFVFGLDYFLHIMPPPKGPFPAPMMNFAGALAQSGYMMELIKGTEVLCGALFLLNLFVPLALVIIAPVIVNIVAFHLFLAPSGLPLALVLVVLASGLAWSRRDAFRPLFARR
jgi:hypothetical protein